MTERSSTAPASLPPSEPRPSSRPVVDLGERPVRLQMVVALVLGLALVSIPLYLWRRPRTEADPIPSGQTSSSSSSSARLASADLVVAPRADGGSAGPTLSEMRVVSCGDGKKESKRSESRREACDRPVGFDKLFARAIADSADCVADSSGGGSISFHADVGFTRKKSPIHVTAPKDSRSLKNPKVASGCVKEIRRKLEGTTLDMHHDHNQYKVEIVATYPGAVK